MRATLQSAAVAGAMAFVSSPAAAQEYCISCATPNVLYRCVIEGARPGLGTSFPAACVTALTTHGNHASCTLRRDLGVIDCNGPVKHVAVPSEAGGRSTVIPPVKIVEPAPPEGPPKTVEAMIGRARGTDKPASPDGAKPTDLGGLFLKSLKCVSSLFLQCDK